jgi:hypothetical protein
VAPFEPGERGKGLRATVIAAAETPPRGSQIRRLDVPVVREPWPPGEWVPLLDAEGLGGWRIAQGGIFDPQAAAAVTAGCLELRAPGDRAVGLAFSHEVPATDYEIRFEAMRTHGTQYAAALVFPVASAHCLWAVGNQGIHFGLDLVDGKRDTEIGNPTNRRFDIADGRWYRFALRVERARIQAWMDIQTMVDVPTFGHTFALAGEFRELRPLGLLVGGGTGVRVRNLRLRRLGTAPRPELPVPELPEPLKQVFLALNAGDLRPADDFLIRALAEARRDEAIRRSLDDTYLELMRRSVAAGRRFQYESALAIAHLAWRIREQSQDARNLMEWAADTGRSPLATQFLFGGLGGLKPLKGHWQVEDDELVCLTEPDAAIELDGVSYRDFSFEIDVTSGRRRPGLRLGVFFRSWRGRFLYFLLSDEEDCLAAGGGAGELCAMPLAADGVSVSYPEGRRAFPVGTGITYHLQVVCIGRKVACYVNDQLAAECSDDGPESGRLGLLARRADAHFDNLRLHRIAPMPELDPALTEGPKAP